MMYKREQILAILKRELPYISKEYNVSRIGIFGSFADDKADKESDVDILVEFSNPVGLKFISLAEYLEKLLNRKIDLLTKEGLNSIRIKEVAQDIRSHIIYA